MGMEIITYLLKNYNNKIKFKKYHFEKYIFLFYPCLKSFNGNVYLQKVLLLWQPLHEIVVMPLPPEREHIHNNTFLEYTCCLIALVKILIDADTAFSI